LFVPAVPLLLWLCGARGFLFDRPGSLDAFVYVGYFLHYPEHLPVFDEYYKISRLPWVLPGWACYRVFGPQAGHVILQLGTLSIALGCLFILLRRALTSSTALVGVILLGTSVWFHGCGGWSYHMTLTTGCWLLSLLGVQRSADSRRPWLWQGLAGTAFAMAVHMHLFIVVLGPGLLLHYLLACRATGRRPRFLDAVPVLAGALAATAFLAGVNKATGGNWLFFMPQIQYTLHLSRHGNAWHQPLAAWLPRSTFMALALAAVLACPLTWRLLRRQEVDARTRLFIAGCQLQLGLGLLAGWYYQLVKKQNVLDTSYLSVYLLGPVILTLVCLFHVAQPDAFRRRPLRLGVFFLAVSLATLVTLGLLAPWLGTAFRAIDSSSLFPVTARVLVSGMGLLLAVWLLGEKKALAGLFLLALGNAFSSPHLSKYQPTGPSLNRDLYDLAIEVDRFTSSLDPSLVDIKYWFDEQEMLDTHGEQIQMKNVFNSVVSTRAWLVRLLGGAPVPPIEGIKLTHLGGARRVAVLSTSSLHEGNNERMQAQFERLGCRLKDPETCQFQHGELDVTLTVWRVAGGE